MADCKDCEALNGQGVQTGPHENLSCDSEMARSDGNLEQFHCRACRARWERHNWPRNEMPGSKHRFWTRL